MYSLGERYKKNNWGIPGYDITKKYVSFQKDSVGTIGNFEKKVSPLKHTKKYQQIKDLCLSPCPAQYSKILEWSPKQQEAKETDRKRKKLIKNTYLEQIEKQSERVPQPGVGKYRIPSIDFPEIKNSAQSNYGKSKRTILGNSPKVQYLNDEILNAREMPGVGQYYTYMNPIKEKNKIDKDHKYWIKKHHQQSPVKERLSPAPGQYNPIPMDRNTFESIEKDFQRSCSAGALKKKSQKIPDQTPNQINDWSKYCSFGFGVEVRFKEKSKSPSKITQASLQSSGPGTYDTISYWPGKLDKKGGEIGKKKLDQIITTHSPEKSIYY